MEENNIQRILKEIIGEAEYDNLISDIVNEYSDTDYELDVAEPIINSYIIAILLIGMSKKAVNIDNYNIHLINNENLKINTLDFCKDYSHYINKVENFKLDLLRKLLK